MARNDFILNVRTAASLLAPQHVQVDSARVNSGARAAVLDNAELWLTPGSVGDFDPADFSDLPTEKRKVLSQEIDHFLATARQVPHDAPATKSQSQRARNHLKKVIALVSESVIEDWRNALERLSRDLEQWARNQQWDTRKETKQATETMLGTYEVPRLLVHGPIGRLVIDPVARFAAGCDGLVEMSAMPSYDSAKLTRDGTQWFLHALRPHGEPQPLNEARFFRTTKKLLEAA